MNKTYFNCLFIWVYFSFISFNTSAQSDSILTFRDFYSQVMTFHPLVKQAQLLSSQAKMELRTARGGFDPMLGVDYHNKTTNGNNSYTYFTPELKIPTRIGVDVKGGMEMTSGSNLNPEDGKLNASGNVTGYNMFYGGISVPLGRGLVFDDRRATLRQAQLFQTLAQAEQIKLVNKILLESAKDYWNWQQSYQLVVLMNENVRLAENRLAFIINRIKLGEEKPIDSTEAFIEFNRREVMLAEAEVFQKNAALQLSNYLWNDKSEPLQLRIGIIPSSIGIENQMITPDSLQNLVSATYNNHPELVKITNKISSLEIDRKMAKEQLKPKLTIDYFPFRTFTNGTGDGVNNIFMNNYKLGVNFSSSLFLRKERGKLAITDFKLKQVDYELQYRKRELVNDVLASYNDLLNNQKLLIIQQNIVRNAVAMRNAELIRFESGESSLFLVNQRERSLIESQSKLVELNAKYAKSKMQLQWSSGVNMFK